jgi:spore maturation protein B
VALSTLAPLAVPGLVLLGMLAARRSGADVYEALCAGAKKGLETTLSIAPALLALFPAVWLLRASGLPELLGALLDPLLSRLGIPGETALLLLLRPLSGSGALSAAADIIAHYGPDSLVGRTAAVMLGSSETTFYVVAVYFSAAGVKESRWAIPAALCADLMCFLSAAWVCRWFWG